VLTHAESEIGRRLHRSGQLISGAQSAEQLARPGNLETHHPSRANDGHHLAAPRCKAITTWGLTDRYSWIDTTFGPDDPLLMDEDYGRKPAFYAVHAALLDGGGGR
jgi:GH35 family endo-1,4-beta-xylanase